MNKAKAPEEEDRRNIRQWVDTIGLSDAVNEYVRSAFFHRGMKTVVNNVGRQIRHNFQKNRDPNAKPLLQDFIDDNGTIILGIIAAVAL